MPTVSRIPDREHAQLGVEIDWGDGTSTNAYLGGRFQTIGKNGEVITGNFVENGNVVPGHGSDIFNAIRDSRVLPKKVRR